MIRECPGKRHWFPGPVPFPLVELRNRQEVYLTSFWFLTPANITKLVVTKPVMEKHDVSLREAKAHLSDLTARAASGSEITITKHGRPTARLVPPRAPRQPVSLQQLQALTESLPKQAESAHVAVWRLRDQARY